MNMNSLKFILYNILLSFLKSMVVDCYKLEK